MPVIHWTVVVVVVVVVARTRDERGTRVKDNLAAPVERSVTEVLPLACKARTKDRWEEGRKERRKEGRKEGHEEGAPLTNRKH